MNKFDLLKQIGYSQEFIDSFSEYEKSKNNEIVISNPIESNTFIENESFDTTSLEITFTKNFSELSFYSVK